MIPTKRQKELLNFLQSFITEHGYAPSYREIMNGLRYNSIATVAKHVDNLVAKGLVRKRDHSARSLEILGAGNSASLPASSKSSSGSKWLIEQIETHFKHAESAPKISQTDIDTLYVLVAALKVLGAEEAFVAFNTRLQVLKKQRH